MASTLLGGGCDYTDSGFEDEVDMEILFMLIFIISLFYLGFISGMISQKENPNFYKYFYAKKWHDK